MGLLSQTSFYPCVLSPPRSLVFHIIKGRSFLVLICRTNKQTPQLYSSPFLWSLIGRCDIWVLLGGGNCSEWLLLEFSSFMASVPLKTVPIFLVLYFLAINGVLVLYMNVRIFFFFLMNCEC